MVVGTFAPLSLNRRNEFRTWENDHNYVDEYTSTLFLMFDISPVGLFHRLMSRVAQQVGSKVELHYRQIWFPVAEKHWVLIEMIPHPEALIKVYADIE